MQQIERDAWTAWNTRTRESLVLTQKRGGTADGSWDPDSRYSDRGGRVYTTALATLTLEVYYRYLPMRPEDKAGPAVEPEVKKPEARPAAKPAKVKKPVLEPS